MGRSMGMSIDVLFVYCFYECECLVSLMRGKWI